MGGWKAENGIGSAEASLAWEFASLWMATAVQGHRSLRHQVGRQAGSDLATSPDGSHVE